MSSIVSINNESVSYNKKDDLNVSSNSSSSSSLANPITESSPKSLAPIESLKLQESNKNCIDELEFNFQEKFKETNREIENVSHEMTSLSSFIAEARQKYENLKNQYRFQLDTLIKLNEEIRNDMHQIESRNEHLKAENLKLKAENKQFYGEFVIISKELDEQYCNGVEDMNLEEIERQMGRLKSDIAKLILSNQTLNKQLSLSSENIKYLQKVYLGFSLKNFD
jgi:chromosome segregation ATPase